MATTGRFIKTSVPVIVFLTIFAFLSTAIYAENEDSTAVFGVY